MLSLDKPRSTDRNTPLGKQLGRADTFPVTPLPAAVNSDDVVDVVSVIDAVVAGGDVVDVVSVIDAVAVDVADDVVDVVSVKIDVATPTATVALLRHQSITYQTTRMT